jgi:lipoic acid synthetase
MSACGARPPCSAHTPELALEPSVDEGRKLLRLEVRNAQTPIERKPEWIKTKAKMGPSTRPCSRS